MTAASNIRELTLEMCDFFSKCVIHRQEWVTFFVDEILAPRYHSSYLLSLKSLFAFAFLVIAQHRRIT